MHNLFQMWFDDVLDHGMCSRSYFFPHIFSLVSSSFILSIFLSLFIISESLQKGFTSAGYFKQSLIPDIMKIVLKSALKGTSSWSN